MATFSRKVQKVRSNQGVQAGYLGSKTSVALGMIDTAISPLRRNRDAGRQSVVAASHRNLAAVASVYVCASAAWQHEPAF